MRVFAHILAAILALSVARQWWAGNNYTTASMAILALAVAVNLLMYALAALDRGHHG